MIKRDKKRIAFLTIVKSILHILEIIDGWEAEANGRWTLVAAGCTCGSWLWRSGVGFRPDAHWTNNQMPRLSINVYQSYRSSQTKRQILRIVVKLVLYNLSKTTQTTQDKLQGLRENSQKNSWEVAGIFWLKSQLSHKITVLSNYLVQEYT